MLILEEEDDSHISLTPTKLTMGRGMARQQGRKGTERVRKKSVCGDGRRLLFLPAWLIWLFKLFPPFSVFFGVCSTSLLLLYGVLGGRCT